MTAETVLTSGGKDKGDDYTEVKDLACERCSILVYLELHSEKLHAFPDRLGLSVANI